MDETSTAEAATVPPVDVPRSPDVLRETARALSVQAICLAMQNAVAQQQHAYTLLNSITAVAARAILDSRA